MHKNLLNKALCSFLSVPLLALSACSDDGSTTGGTSGGEEKGGAIEVLISGEDLATDGFLFPEGSEVVITDGWEVKFTHVLVTVDKITLAENPDKTPADQSQTDEVVAEATGPWAVDLHKEGSASGAGGEGKAISITTFTAQNANGDKPFEADRRYAFGYDVVEASAQAKRVNFEGDPAAEAAYAEMVEKKYTVLYVGEATFKGTTCESSDPGYDFTKVPSVVSFRLGFSSPVSLINCQNQENQGDPFPDEEYQRGVAVPQNAAATAQMTFHLDHPFYSDVEHEPSLFFLQYAARLVGKPAGTTLTMDDLVGVDPTAFTDGAGADLPFRVCDGSPLPAGKQMGFEVGSVPVNPSAAPGEALRDYRDYAHYVQSTQGHLNGGEGLCYVKRRYLSPP